MMIYDQRQAVLEARRTDVIKRIGPAVPNRGMFVGIVNGCFDAVADAADHRRVIRDDTSITDLDRRERLKGLTVDTVAKIDRLAESLNPIRSRLRESRSKLPPGAYLPKSETLDYDNFALVDGIVSYVKSELQG